MGLHAFKDEPDHCALYRELFPSYPLHLVGLKEKWNVVGAHHCHNLGEGLTFRGVPHYVLSYHISGATALRRDMKDQSAERDTLSMQAPMSGGTFGSLGKVNYWHLYFQQCLLDEVARENNLEDVATPDDMFGQFVPELQRDVLSYITRASELDDPPTTHEMDNRSYLIAHGILRAAKQRQGEKFDMAAHHTGPDLHEVFEMIENRLSEPLRLCDLAASVHMSPFHFSRIFKASTGRSPMNYVQERRTRRAIEWIRNTDLPLAEIAYRCGFSSQSHMSRAVKQATGATPRTLR